MKIYAVMDTNVIVTALLSKHEDSATVKAINAILNSGSVQHMAHLKAYTKRKLIGK